MSIPKQSKELRNMMENLFYEEKVGISWVTKFENNFSKKFDSRYSIAVNSGTSGLHAALLAGGIGKGDEVIQPAITVIMDSYVTLHVGAKPVFVDVDKDTWNMDPLKIEELITENTKAIITVSIYGLPVNITKIMDIAKKYNLLVIDDSAETFLSRYEGKLYSNKADLTVYSFERSKHMTSGSEGGMVTTNNEKLAQRVRQFAGIGYRGLKASAGRTSLASEVYQDPNYERFDEIGFNYRMNAVTAAFGNAQLEILDNLVEKRKKIGGLFLEAIKGCKWMTPQKVDKSITHTYFTFGVVYEGEKHKGIKWKDFYNQYLEKGGDGFYACWKNPYLEPSLKNKKFGTQKWDIGLCKNAEILQKKIMAFKTNYKDINLAKRKISILSDLIDQIGRE